MNENKNFQENKGECPYSRKDEKNPKSMSKKRQRKKRAFLLEAILCGTKKNQHTLHQNSNKQK